jgi:hypothetical protein
MRSEGIAPSFLVSALDRGEWLASRPCCFILGERALGTYLIGDRVDAKVVLDAGEKRKMFSSARNRTPFPRLELCPLLGILIANIEI